MTLAANRSRFTIEVSGSQEPLRVIGFKGIEALSDVYEFDVVVASENPNLDTTAFIKQAAALTIQGETNPGETDSRFVHGEICLFQQQEIGRKFHTYKIRLVPKIWYLQHRTNSLIFQNLTVPDIIKQMLETAQISGQHYQFRLTTNYSPRIYCVQHQETDYQFICRLMREEGMHFHFEHDAGGHKLIIGDNKPAFPQLSKALDYYPVSGMVPEQDTLYRLSFKRKAGVGKVVLQDFNFEQPGLNLAVNQAEKQQQALEHYHYPGEYDLPANGESRAKLQLQALQAAQREVTGQTNAPRLTAGHRITVQQHPVKKLNQDYLLVKVEHIGRQPQSLEEEANGKGCQYNNSVVALPSEIPFRSQVDKKVNQIAHQPKGIQTAVVTGPGGEEIYTNAHGQIKVQYQWDRQGQLNENSSCWIRVAQNWTGPQWGSLVLPRVGQEIMLDFINSNPSQPIVAGRLYNKLQPVPYKLPINKTRTTLKSQSSLGGEGFNEIRFEDKKGQEQVFIHGEKELDWHVKNEQREQVKCNRHLITHAARYEQIKSEQHVVINMAKHLQIAQSQHQTVGNNYQLTTATAHLEQFGQEAHLKSGMKIIIEAGSQAILKVGGAFITLGSDGIKVQGPLVRLNSGGSASSGSAISPTSAMAALQAATDIAGKVTAALTAAPSQMDKLNFPALCSGQLNKGRKNDAAFCEQCEQGADK
ncbi:type VI secretion system Vgr family protein [Spartinivicinus poritis]|uniref:Type VI secretion system tip protein TssI/VgrG n=1 Tax=Spartinivicinus poritis TaxID=2994640 RepID=A0ABT5UF27_9GAMM|nr:type VI secretion system tip protein TssI/VgrG [Spartinivicinus sp. A2-2]MDE1464976.1 type VI secretion system tip protein TssI/VgrG [Spartinivicinus sp. A2-2]